MGGAKLAGLSRRQHLFGASSLSRPLVLLNVTTAPLCFANAEDFAVRALEAWRREKAPVEWFSWLNSRRRSWEIRLHCRGTCLQDSTRELTDHGIARDGRVSRNLYNQLHRAGIVELGRSALVFSRRCAAVASLLGPRGGLIPQ